MKDKEKEYYRPEETEKKLQPHAMWHTEQKSRTKKHQKKK